MRIGRPEQFKNKVSVRLEAIDLAASQYRISASKLLEGIQTPDEGKVVLFVKGFGNEATLLTTVRELYFNSRELLDYVLGRLNSATQGKPHQTPRDFLPFLRKLTRGELDSHQLNTLFILKKSAGFIFHIRKIRNLIKSDPSRIEFVFNTTGFEAHMRLPLDKCDEELAHLLNIHDLEQAVANGSYGAIVKLDKAFSGLRTFWDAVLLQMSADGL